MKDNECDKVQHTYVQGTYERDFVEFRAEKINLLEVGIWMGTSHQSWIDYFERALVFGIDIFSRMTPATVPVLKNPRMFWAEGDSTDKASVDRCIDEMEDQVQETIGGFDVIIDDGKHTPEANARTLTNLWPYLKSGGFYYIEDVWPLNKMTKEERNNNNWLRSHPEDYNDVSWNNFNEQMLNLPELDNIVEVDCRKSSGKPDSVIYRLRKV